MDSSREEEKEKTETDMRKVEKEKSKPCWTCQAALEHICYGLVGYIGTKRVVYTCG